MNNQNERTFNRLNSKLETLQNELSKPNKSIEDLDDLLEEIKSLEEEKKNEAKQFRLNTVNRTHAERRAMLKEVLALKLPTEDIRTNDSSFHATKVKKYPELVAFLEKHKYVSFDFEHGAYSTMRYNRHTYRLFKTEYKYQEPTKLIEFSDFDEALSFNGVQAKSMTFAKYLSLEAKILKESDRLKAEINKSEEKMKALGSYFLESERLINSQRPSYQQYYSI